jgi:alpha-1,6-mannosyltransferase
MPLEKNKKSVTLLLLGFLSCIAYYVFAYHLVRTDTIKLAVFYTLLFGLFYVTVNQFKEKFKLLVLLSVLVRLIFIAAIPNLSQDFYRFIWDGRMILAGFNPFLYTPISFIELGQLPVAQANELYQGMGTLSGGNHTNYPPLNQLCFVIAGLFSSNSILGSVIVMRLIIVLADIGTLLVGKKLLEKLQLPSHTIFWYILNPFIIIELTGNLHFEAVMIFFLVVSLYLLHQNKWQMAAVVLAFSVSIKLLPLIFLPLFFKKLRFKKWVAFCAVVVGITVLLFAPFISTEFLINYADTVALWFRKFEFNASIYYVLRAIGYTFRGYNEIAIIGKIISIAVILFVLVFAMLKKNMSTIGLIYSMLFVIAFYFFTTTTMHPWYLATPLLLSLFTKYRFTLVWSFVIFLSYFAYVNNTHQENYWLLIVEYSVVYAVFFYEIYTQKKDTKKPAITD